MQMCWDLPGNPNAVAPPQVCSTQRLPLGGGAHTQETCHPRRVSTSSRVGDTNSHAHGDVSIPLKEKQVSLPRGRPHPWF